MKVKVYKFFPLNSGIQFASLAYVEIFFGVQIKSNNTKRHQHNTQSNTSLCLAKTATAEKGKTREDYLRKLLGSLSYLLALSLQSPHSLLLLPLSLHGVQLSNFLCFLPRLRTQVKHGCSEASSLYRIWQWSIGEIIHPFFYFLGHEIRHFYMRKNGLQICTILGMHLMFCNYI